MKKLVIIFICIVLVIAGIVMYYFCNYDNNLVDVNEVKTDSKYENVIYDKQEDIWDEDALGILTIEKIGLNATVKEGTSSKILKDYIGHIEETSTFDGNIGLART